MSASEVATVRLMMLAALACSVFSFMFILLAAVAAMGVREAVAADLAVIAPVLAAAAGTLGLLALLFVRRFTGPTADRWRRRAVHVSWAAGVVALLGLLQVVLLLTG